MKKNLFAVALATSLLSSAAFAGDASRSGNSAYIRLDAGYSVSTKFKHNNQATTTNKNKLGESGIFGGGVGYRFNENVRTDFTLSYIPNYELKYGKTNDTNIKSKVKSLVGLVSVYYDMATYGIVSPYITGGVGFAQNNMKTLFINTPTSSYTQRGKKTTNFAWAIGTGIATSLGNGFFGDIGYRFLDIGPIKSGTATTLASLPNDAAYKSKNVRSHQIIASLRCEF